MDVTRREIAARMTAEILACTTEHPLHLRHRESLGMQPVSCKSVWSDPRWIFDNTTKGAKESGSTFVWELELPDGSNLLDLQHANMLDWLRRLIWSAYAAPGDGAAILKPGSLGQISAGTRYWVAWLVDRHITWPFEITPIVVDAFVAHLREELVDDTETSQLTESVACNRLNPFAQLWRQRFALQRAGIAPMLSPPFNREGVYAVAREIAAIASGSWRPLPDEVALSVLNTAMRLLGTPAQDVMTLTESCATAQAAGLAKEVGYHWQKRLSIHYQAEAARAFRFSAVDDNTWNLPLNIDDWDQVEVRSISDSLKTYLDSLRDEWRDQSSGDQRPTLPTIDLKDGYGARVDLRRIALTIGRRAGDEQYLTQHPMLHRMIEIVAREQGLGRVPFIGVMQRVRQLVIAIQSAAHLVIQATSGMRISEICGVKAGLDSTTGLPLHVEIRDSLSGLGEVFILRSALSKTEETPRAVEWTLGSRPKGSSDLPPAVHAILILSRLLAPHRQLLGTDDLFLGFTSARALPRTRRGVRRIGSHTLREAAKDFIAAWVDLAELPDEAGRRTMDRELVAYRESHGRIVNTHQLRKLFANFAIRVDPRLLPVLQMHFHHVSQAMTDGGYIGTDPTLLRDQYDARYQHMAILALEIARGDTRIAGRFGEDLEQKVRTALADRTRELSTEDAYREAYIYVSEDGLGQLFFEPHGVCGARSASQMACQLEAGTDAVARWRRRLKPNYATRTPTLCAGCESFAVAKWHLPFWEQRYIDYMAEIQQLEANGMVGPDYENANALTLARARQAQALCHKLGADLDELERRVAARVKELLHAANKIESA